MPFTLKCLDWDSGELGVKCGLIDATHVKKLPKGALLIDKIERLCRKRKEFDFITIKLPSERAKEAKMLAKNGLYLVGQELAFSYDKKRRPVRFNDMAPNLRFIFHKRCDGRPFRPLAADMRYSRFFLDPKIPKDRAIRLWKDSIINHCNGFADQLIVAYNKGTPCGLVTIRFNNRHIFLHIVGVLKRFRGHKISYLMLKKIIERYGKRYSIFVEAQSKNIAAQVIYRRAGFRRHDAKYVLHYWQ